jgi:hypothetical protein
VRITVEEGAAFVRWNDRGDETGQYPQEVQVDGVHYQIRSDKALRNLYDCLDFLFGSKP